MKVSLITGELRTNESRIRIKIFHLLKNPFLPTLFGRDENSTLSHYGKNMEAGIVKKAPHVISRTRENGCAVTFNYQKDRFVKIRNFQKKKLT